MNGGVFYTDQATEIIIDPQAQRPLPTQNMLLDSLRRCNDLVQRDMRYAHLVAGASKMPMSMIWSARNQDELVNDSDLAKLKDLTWNEFIKKRYLPAIAGGSSLSSTASSMLEIVREMNLQRRRFQIMGLHEQVEASEIQLVLHLCQAQILRPTTSSDYYRSLANRFRRHDRFYEAFALAVGAFVCSSAPYTLGAATTRYERDLQFEYKKHTTALFVYVLQQYPGMVGEAGVYDEDYVLRISRLIVVWPSAGGDDWFDGGSDVLHSFPGAPPPTSTPPDKDMLLNAVVAAQTQAEKAERTASKAQREMLRTVADAAAEVRTSIVTIDEKVDAVKEEVGTAVRDLREELRRAKLEEDLRTVTQTLHLKEMIFTMLGVRPGADGAASENVFTAVKETLKKEMNDKIERLEREDARIVKEMDGKIKELESEGARFKKEMDGKIEELKTEDRRLGRLVAESVASAEARLNATIGTSCTAVEGRLDAKMKPLHAANATFQGFQTEVTAEIIAHKAQLMALVSQIQGVTGVQPLQPDNSAAAAVGAFMANPNTGLAIWASNISLHNTQVAARLSTLENITAIHGTHTADIATHTAEIAAHTTLLQSQQQEIDKHTVEIGDVKTDVTAVSAASDEQKNKAEERYIAHEAKMRMLEMEDTANEARVETINQFLLLDADEEDDTLEARIQAQLDEVESSLKLYANERALMDRNAIFDRGFPPQWLPEINRVVAEGRIMEPPEAGAPITPRVNRPRLDPTVDPAAPPAPSPVSRPSSAVKRRAEALDDNDEDKANIAQSHTAAETDRRLRALEQFHITEGTELRLRALERFMRLEQPEGDLDTLYGYHPPLPETANYEPPPIP